MKRLLLLFFCSYLSAGTCGSKAEVKKVQEIKKIAESKQLPKKPVILKKKLLYKKSKAEVKPVYPTRSPKKIHGYYQRTTYYETVFYK